MPRHRAFWMLLPAIVLSACFTPDGQPPISAPQPPIAVTPPISIDRLGATFELPMPAVNQQARELSVWGTHYFTLTYEDNAQGVPLLGTANQPLGVSLSARDFCHAVLEGSAIVKTQTGNRLFNYADARGPTQTNCDAFLGGLSDSQRRASERVRFTELDTSRTPFGVGVRNMPLQPYRTVAVDPSYIPYGTVLFIPAARGNPFTDENGVEQLHDGWFFAGDTGGAIKSHHIDVFTGSNNRPVLLGLITNRESRTTQAYVIDSQHPAVLWLTSLHRP